MQVGNKRYDLADVGTRKITSNAGIAAEAPGIVANIPQNVGSINDPAEFARRKGIFDAGGEAQYAIKQRLGYVPADYLDNRQKYDALMLSTANDANKVQGEITNQQGIRAIDAPYKQGLISNARLGIEEGASARKYAADQKALYDPTKTEKATIDAASKKQERLIAGRALLMSKPEFAALDEASQNNLLEKFAYDPETEAWIPGKAGKDAVSHWFSKNEPAVDPTPGRRVSKVNAPPGMTVIGTSGGKPVYQDAQGNRHIGA
jgi:hypothetical protein